MQTQDTQPRRLKMKGTTGIYQSRSGSYEINYRADDGRLVWKTIGTNLAEAKAARAELVVAKKATRSHWYRISWATRRRT